MLISKVRGASLLARTLSDPLSQYIALRQHYARKSTDEAAADESGKGKATSKPVARIATDSSRVYWPGQEVIATISIDEAACESEGALDELVAEVKGEVHSFIYVYQANGVRTPVYAKQSIFSHSVTLYSRSNSSAAPTMQAEPVAASRDGTRAWQVRTTLPLTFRADDGNEYPLPPTFKDTTASRGRGTAFVVYSVKAVAKRGGAFKRDSR